MYLGLLRAVNISTFHRELSVSQAAVASVRRHSVDRQRPVVVQVYPHWSRILLLQGRNQLGLVFGPYLLGVLDQAQAHNRLLTSKQNLH